MELPATPGRSKDTAPAGNSASAGAPALMGVATSVVSPFAQSDPDSPRLRASTLAYRPYAGRPGQNIGSPPTPKAPKSPSHKDRSTPNSGTRDLADFAMLPPTHNATQTSATVPRTPVMHSALDGSFANTQGNYEDISYQTPQQASYQAAPASVNYTHTPDTNHSSSASYSIGTPGPVDFSANVTPHTPVRSLSQPHRTHQRSASSYRSTTGSYQSGGYQAKTPHTPHITVASQNSHQRTPSASRTVKHDTHIPGTNEVPLTTSRKPQKRTSIGPWDLIKSIGAGSMGQVKLAVNRNTKQLGAVKIVPKAFTQRNKDSRESNEAKDARVTREAAIGQLLDHPNISRLYNVYSMTGHFYLVFEYINGGQMLDYIIAHGCVKETQARRFARSISSALDYCHHNSVVHRDLKIENILIADDGDIRLIDFGLSNLFRRDDLLRTFCGSLYFAAPELLNALPYVGPEIDVWSFGVVLYVLVCGKVPFEDKSMTVLHAKIKRGTVEYPQWLSSLCVDLLSRMLTVNPSERATLSEVMHHPWMQKGYDSFPDSKLPKRIPLTIENLDSEVIEEMEAIGIGEAHTISRKLRNILSGIEYQMALDNWNDQHQVDLGKYLNHNDHPGSVDRSRNTAFSPQSTIFSRSNSNSSGSPNLHHANLLVSSSTVVTQETRDSRYPDPLDSFAPEISCYFLTKEKLARERNGNHNKGTPLALSEPNDGTKNIAEDTTGPVQLSQHLSSPEPNIKMGRLRAKTLGAASDVDPPALTFTPADNPSSKPLRQPAVALQPPISRLEFSGGSSKQGRVISEESTEAPQPAYISSIPQQAQIGILSTTPAKPIDLGRQGTPGGLEVGFESGTDVAHAPVTPSMHKSRIVSQPLPQQYSSPQPSSAGNAYSQPMSLFRKLSLRRKPTGHGRAKSTGHSITESFNASRVSNHSNSSGSSEHAMPSIESPKPVYFKGIFSVQTTSTKPLKEIRAELIRVLTIQQIDFVEVKGGFACIARSESTLKPTNLANTSASSSAGTSRSSTDEGRRPTRQPSTNYSNIGNELVPPSPQTPPSAAMRHRRMLSENGIISPSASVGGSLESIDMEIGASDMLGFSQQTSSVPVRFEIDIVRVPIISLHGIQFKKMTGNVWHYKNIAQKILEELRI